MIEIVIVLHEALTPACSSATTLCLLLESFHVHEDIQDYSRLSLSRNRRDPQKQFEISVLRHIRFVVLRKKQFAQPIFTNDYVI